MTTKYRPKVGLALAGASSRSVFYIGFLEVLKEEGFDIDYISTLSGGSIIAAAYSCGTLPELKKRALKIDKELVFSIIEKSKGKSGLYQLDKVEEIMQTYTKNLRFEDVHPRLGIVATDITAGEAVVLEIGDLARAICASCALPFIFEPIPWGNRLLVDGGVAGVVPGSAARKAGMDIVIGVDLSAKTYVFSWWQVLAGRLVKSLKKIFLVDHASLLWDRISAYASSLDSYDTYSSLINEATVKRPGMFSVLGRSVDIALAAQKIEDPRKTDYNCDLLIAPPLKIPWWKRHLFFLFTDFSNIEEMYELGRETAREYLPEMRQLIDNFDEPR
jgi:predicted acylesterase/phospholipase RssA